MHRLKQDYAGRNFLFIAEGVLMYLREAEVRSLLRDLADNFPGAHLAFDTAGSFVCKKMNKNSAVSKLNAEMTSVVMNLRRQPGQWHPAAAWIWLFISTDSASAGG